MPVQIAAVNVNMPATAFVVITTIARFIVIAATIVMFKLVTIAAVATAAVFFGQSNAVDTVYFKRSVIVRLQAFSAIIADFKRIEIAKLALAATYAVAVV